MSPLKNKFGAIVGLMLIGSNLNASNAARVSPTSVELHVEKHDFHVKITKVIDNDKSVLSEILVRFKDKSFSVPKEELDVSGGGFVLSETRLLVRVSPGTDFASEALEDIIISIPYGKITVNHIGEYSLDSRDEVRFVFKNGRFVERVRSEATGQEKALWQTFTKVPGENEVKRDIIEGIKNPFGAEILRRR